MKPTKPPALITFPVGARRLGVTPATAEKLAKDGRFLRPFWLLLDLAEVCRDRRRVSGSWLRQPINIMREGIYPDEFLDVNLNERFHRARITLDKMLDGQPPVGQSLLERRAPDRKHAHPTNNAVYARNPGLREADQRFASRMAQEEAMDLGRSTRSVRAAAG